MKISKPTINKIWQKLKFQPINLDTMTADVAVTILQYFGINVSVNSNLCFQNNDILAPRLLHTSTIKANHISEKKLKK